jgi:hypothetical protein
VSTSKLAVWDDPLSIIQASHGTALFTLSCGNLCCSDYSGVTLK